MTSTSAHAGTGRAELVRVPIADGWVSVRDICPRDVDTFVEYWHGGGADLEFLGIDPAKLGTREETRARFESYIRTGDPRQEAVGFTFARDGRAIGYANVNIFGRPRGWLHVHLVDAGARGQGIVSAVFAHSLPVIAELLLEQYGLESVVLETRTRNDGIDRVVRKTGLRPVATRVLEDPDGVAGRGEFNVYELDAARIRALLAARERRA